MRPRGCRRYTAAEWPGLAPVERATFVSEHAMPERMYTPGTTRLECRPTRRIMLARPARARISRSTIDYYSLDGPARRRTFRANRRPGRGLVPKCMRQS